mmetsp:Transcript_29279/g.33967  ORF Transcript_29279/g.33967 Transcript_29279/m.33967 type:complete len:427 (+) Transcript_29279:102-1382(+)
MKKESSSCNVNQPDVNKKHKLVKACQRLASIQGGQSITFKRARKEQQTCEQVHKETTNRKQHNDRTQQNDPINSPYGNCPNVSLRYKKESRIGQGTYGIVYKAFDTITKKTVALKKCFPHHESSDGFPITTLREIQILQELKHDNIVHLKEVAVSSKQSGVFLVFEFCSFDLANLVDEYYAKHSKSPFTIPETKCLSRQLLSALTYIHDRCIIHRDLKLSNLLYDKQRGVMKLCDFGLARRLSKHEYKSSRKTDNDIHVSASPHEHLTPKVVSLWYRPPELLLNSDQYDYGLDLWGVGCVVAEILLGVPLFKGKSEMHQLSLIVNLLGQPTTQNWPGLEDMPLIKEGNCELPFRSSFSHHHNKHIHSKLLDKFSHLSSAGIHFFANLLKYDSKARWTAKHAFQSSWFKESPLATGCEYMPKFPWKN